ncbi:uncharacterized protein Z520_05336 [Fonsecaea multimorphosa CBS 102226]|uniref:Nucleoside phosphorylase domain-containing protein n=1 Tax=Fonsecaea multimorphosa CBS 102226 TaxID=1442371 RepID=A0A0D2HAH8_9EURO|nr:uncharacterized protein Z520_05336 [Fonsecaea multimorphosa CBS 102226]KIX98875.1 hypothetical protein Z520_05336 [Fonsecaea multimorphosa CBS 102226]
MSSFTVRRVHDYQVACICTLQIELDAITAMLDEKHEGRPQLSDRSQNAYIFGRIGEHNIVVTLTTRCGNTLAAAVATQLVNDFPRIKFCFLVGIGGGIPSEEKDIRLGDVVVSNPEGGFGGVVEYDLGKMHPDGRFERTGVLNKPPRILTTYCHFLCSKGEHWLRNQMSNHLKDMIKSRPDMRETFSFPGENQDHLFKATYRHQGGSTCSACLTTKTEILQRKPRSDPLSHVHFGTIGSGNFVVKDGVIRDRLREDLKVVCVEMEGAGIQESFPGLVIRGISDYADSHKNDHWQPYAAAMATAYMKALLLSIPGVIIAAAEKVQWPNIVSDHALSRAELNQILQRRADNFGSGLRWKESIIDLLKLLHRNSDSKSRDALAATLGVKAGWSGSAERNIALREAVMEELQKNRGTFFPRLGD